MGRKLEWEDDDTKECEMAVELVTKVGEHDFPSIIFLDIDGVLNNMGSITAFGTSHVFDPVSVSLMRRLVVETNSKIVVSSAWRPSQPGKLKELINNISKAGGSELARFIIGYTQRLTAPKRGSEIAKWRRDNKHVGDYVIFDDDDDMLPGQPLIQTSQGRGFGLCEYVKALEILSPLHEDLPELRGYVGMKLCGQRKEAGFY